MFTGFGSLPVDSGLHDLLPQYTCYGMLHVSIDILILTTHIGTARLAKLKKSIVYYVAVCFCYYSA